MKHSRHFQPSSAFSLRRQALARIGAVAVAVAFHASATAQVQVPVLKFASALPANSPLQVQVYEPWVKQVNDAAAGEFQIQVYPGPTFAHGGNVWERITSGVADLGIVVLPQAPRPFPKSSVTALPFMGDDCEAGSAALWRLYAKGITADEYQDIKLINLTMLPVNELISKEPVTRMEDLKGQKVRAADKITADVLVQLGAAPIAVPFSEAYQALSRGVVTAAIGSIYTVSTFKLGEVAKNHTSGLVLGAGPSAIVMNKEAYAKLSPKGKAIIDRFSGEASSRMIGAAHNKLAATYADELRSKPENKIQPFSQAEVARWQAKLEPVKAAWIAQTADGQKVYDAYRLEYAAVKAGK